MTCLRYESSAQQKGKASSRSARERDTGCANRNIRTDGRVVLFNEVVSNELDDQRGLASDIASADNNLQIPSVHTPETVSHQRAAGECDDPSAGRRTTLNTSDIAL